MSLVAALYIVFLAGDLVMASLSRATSLIIEDGL
jgi:hypothetical protein